MKYLLIFLLFPVLVFADWNPVDFKKWQNGEQYQTRIGGQYANYEMDGDSGWAEINNNWLASGDSAFTCNTSILKTHVDSSGRSIVSIKWGEDTYTATSKLNRLMWLRTDTWDTLTIFTNPNWSNYSQDSNIVSWTNVFPQVDYRIRKRNGGVEHGIFFKKLFLDSAVTLFNGRADSAHIALANVIVYTLSANIDDADVALGNINKRKLKDWGRHFFGIDDARLFFPGSDTLQTIPVNHRWLKWNDKIICVEYVKMGRIKQVHEAYPNATIWHNDTKTIDGTTNVEDANMRASPASGRNYGGAANMYIQEQYWHGIIRVKNVASELGGGATISACVCSLYCHTNSTDDDISAYSVFKPWNEGTLDGVDPADAAEGEGVVTWDDWSNDDEEWTTEGCLCDRDGGVDNSYDGGICNQDVRADRKATAEDTENITTVDTWYAWNITAALAQAWYDGTKNEEGVVLISPVDGNNYFYTTESAEAEKPFWVFTYTVEAEGPTGAQIF